MSYQNKRQIKNKILLDILKDIDLNKISNKEAAFFNKKKILITGVSGLIGINLLFFFYKLTKDKKVLIKIDGILNTSIFQFVKSFFRYFLY